MPCDPERGHLLLKNICMALQFQGIYPIIFE